ncbi:MAG: hypothetical protein U9N59_16085 [Campylobacterota bacterium]|nr:hypothetical protein [Campylobacterota bacterium]
MLKIILITLLFYINLFSLSISSDDNYKVFKSTKYNIIYTDDFKNEALFIKENIDSFLLQNDKSFGFSFDEPIRIVLISNNIQVPNAFSSQVPFNLGAYYSGGGGKNDYFSTKSWLITLFTHEMVHNYQINAKKSEISKTLHKYLGNNYMPIFASVVPFFTLPNLMLPTALLEGNSVLNESIYENGGRLYSGEHNAMKNTLLFSDKINLTTFINDHLNFPYTTEKYIVGGFYMRYLAKEYGVDKVNKFFYAHSIHSINPFLLNRTFLTHFGISFENSIKKFIEKEKEQYKNFKELKKKNILTGSMSQVYLSKIKDKIYFITSDLKTKKELNIFDIKIEKHTKEKTSFKNGKIFLKESKLFVNSHDFISSREYKHGLFDEENYIQNETIGKDIQSIYKNKIAHIGIKESFLNTKLFIDDKFYSEISSSAMFDDNGEIYYCKQNGNIRELYKNRDKIYQFSGYYGKIVDIIDDEVYFISNTKNGSGLYKLSENKIYKLNESDNIIDGKIIDNNKVLVVTITSTGYEVQTINIKPKLTKLPISIEIKNNNSFKFINSNGYKNIDIKSTKYNELKELQFSLLYPSYGYDSEQGSLYRLDGLFMDPIMFNMVNIYAYKDVDEKIAGVSYTNERYIPFRIDIYDMKRENKYHNERGYGGSFEIYGPLVKKGRQILDVSLKHYLDDKNRDKNPTIFSINHIYQKNLALESSPYFLSDTKLLLKEDREDITYGIDYKVNKHIVSELYINGEAKVINSNTQVLNDQRGIEVVTKIMDTSNDTTNVLIEGNDDELFVKNISKLSIGISKTFNFYSYYTNFPISLRKESIFYNYNQFELETTNKYTIKEEIIGINLDLLVLHKLPIPLTIKYIKNDSSLNDYKVRLDLGMEF